MSNQINPTNIQLGSVGATAIVVNAGDVSGFMTTARVVIGGTDYVLAAAPYGQAAGFPTEPGLTGVSQANLTHGGLHVSAGSTITLFSATAAALVLAGAATYVP